MDREEKSASAIDDNINVHVIVLPYHSQGHMNQMLQFAKRLAWKRAYVTLATTLSVTIKMKPKLAAFRSTLTLESVYDDTDDPKLEFKDRIDRFEAQVSRNLATLITQARATAKVSLVYDANLQWAVAVAKHHGVSAAAFSTQACSSVAFYYSLYLETLGKGKVDRDLAAFPPLPVVLPDPTVIYRGVPNPLDPDWSSGSELHPVIKMVLEQFKTLDQADWLLFNSFDRLEGEAVKWTTNHWRVKTVGPTLPSLYLDKRVEDDVDYGFNLYKPEDDACLNWLNSKAAGSVVYVSFGSAANLSVEQVVEIAEALKQNQSSFLWVVRETEAENLPSDFISETSDHGLVLSWCPQLAVLAHEAVGCFLTHCGWNSTMEALSFGVPMLAMPQFLDQLIDAHLVDQVWGAGIQPKGDEKGFVTREEIGHCLWEIMQGERGKKIKESATMWKALSKEAVDEGGTSDKHIDEFLAQLASS